MPRTDGIRCLPHREENLNGWAASGRFKACLTADAHRFDACFRGDGKGFGCPQFFYGFCYKRIPSGGGHCTSKDSVAEFCVVIVTNIHDGDESRHPAGKPRIRPIVCGSGFSEGLIIFNTRPRSRAPIDGLCQHGPNGNRCFRCDGTNKLRTVLLQNLSIAVGDLQNAVRFHLFSVICKAAVGHGHFKRRNACRSEGEGEVIRHVWGGYSHFLSHRFDVCNPYNLSEPHDNGID